MRPPTFAQKDTRRARGRTEGASGSPAPRDQLRDPRSLFSSLLDRRRDRGLTMPNRDGHRCIRALAAAAMLLFFAVQGRPKLKAISVENPLQLAEVFHN